MIAPRTKLIAAVAVSGSTAAVAASLMPAIGLPALFLLLAFAAIAAWDGWRAEKAANGLSAGLPDLVRTVRARTSKLPLLIRNTGRETVRELRLVPEFPASFEGQPDETPLTLLEPAKGIQTPLEFRCNRRGEYRIERCWFSSVSRLKLWSVRTSVATNCLVRVYPDIARDKTAAEFLHRERAGSRVRQMTGKGREFSRLREYLPDDPFEDIDWKGTARRGKPVVRTWRAERDQEVYVAVDASRLSARPSSDGTILDRYVHSALVMELAAEAQGDRFGILSFSDRVHQFVKARSGRSHFVVCRDALYQLQPRAVEPDFGELFAFLETRLTRRALVILLTSLDDPLTSETFSRHVGMASRRHLVLAAMPQPEGARPLFSAPAANLHEAYQALAGHSRWRQIAELRKACERQGVRLHLIDPARASDQLASIYLEVKQRQRL
jgi:uncharacterized protein (DUF58 family)